MIITDNLFNDKAMGDVRFSTQTTFIGEKDISRGIRSIAVKHPYESFFGGLSSKFIDIVITTKDISDVDLNDVITISLGFKETSEVSIGRFKADLESIQIDGIKGTTSFTAYDDAVLFDKQYYQVSLPATGKGIIEEIAMRNGVLLDINWQPLLLDNYWFTELNTGEGQSISDRQIINDYMICNLAMGIIKGGKLSNKKVRTSNEVSVTYDGRLWTSLEYGDKEGPINQLVYGNKAEGDDETYQNTVARDDDSISLHGLKEFRFYDNVFLDLLSQEHQQEIVDALFIQINGLVYQPFSMSAFIRPDLEVGDWIKVLDNNDNEITAPISSLEFTWNGGLRGVFECSLLPQTQSENTLSGNDQIIRNALIRVNRAENRINQTVSTVESVQGQVNEQSTVITHLDDKITERIADVKVYVDGSKEEVINFTESRLNGFENTYTVRLANVEGEITEVTSYFTYDAPNTTLVLGKSDMNTELKLRPNEIEIGLKNSEQKSIFAFNGMYNKQWSNDAHVIKSFHEENVKGTIFLDKGSGE